MEYEKVPNEYLLEEIRLNRSAIEEVNKNLSGKVGRGELFGWLTLIGGASGLIVTVMI